MLSELAGWGKSGGELQYASITISNDTQPGADIFYTESVEEAYHVKTFHLTFIACELKVEVNSIFFFSRQSRAMMAAVSSVISDCLVL